METAGELLRRQRLKRKLTFTQVSQLTKIPLKTLKALEKNQYSYLPGPTYIKGFIQNYARVLKTDPQPILAVFRRDYDQQRQKKIMPVGVTKPLNVSLISSLNQNLLALAAAVLLIAGYLGWSVFKLYQPPNLIVSKPNEGEEVTSPVLIKGQTDHDASLTLNGKTVNLNPDGSFTTVYQGVPGATTLTLQATSRREKNQQLVVHVIIVQ